MGGSESTEANTTTTTSTSTTTPTPSTTPTTIANATEDTSHNVTATNIANLMTYTSSIQDSITSETSEGYDLYVIIILTVVSAILLVIVIVQALLNIQLKKKVYKLSVNAKIGLAGIDDQSESRNADQAEKGNQSVVIYATVKKIAETVNGADDQGTTSDQTDKTYDVLYN